ncbi:hypothetical protein AL053_13800 [Pseudomonas savastanoi pv. fraxini]|uniref:hypothetical protein n=1 Tax=Pseudomonas savastanoi TaxID=29438 RepID=UPI00073A46DD|nr:hypothetical protein [Pseudomonas savastanoi]KUG45599.1 hypothetical protein ALP79_200148 [Pseudomonas savastanoi pv. fraxini]KWS81109.1 hypothetical protein AL053_13800 [Pseudomonas savastanoi pv. fraxini]RMR63946.1 hypothetical protein ALP81_200173 [Pseudomonas savastanoi pv. fraxini]RMR68864.1 hypothetical protein ALP82_200194 [Pseudomonas savastanoi pv. fraxini]RMR76683.1 hypothetical protein ALP80_200153 [Pseudomonas savastanoi pv. fraxini]
MEHESEVMPLDIEALYLTLGELLKAGLPKDTPVLITNNEGGFDAALAATVSKVIHYPTEECEADFHLPEDVNEALRVHKVMDQMVPVDAFVIENYRS